MTDNMRRRILAMGAVGAASLAGVFASGKANANTQTPPAPGTTTQASAFHGSLVDVTSGILD